MQTYEKLGAFYLGRMFDIDAGEVKDDLLLYDAKDLTTHAVCVGMTGSGKTGLCVTLLEEAAIDGIPAIVIDPKGDIGNLLLTFPELKPKDFRPWVDPSEAQRKGMTPDEYAANRAALWKKGLAGWDQDGERIGRFRDSVDMTIYTPASNAGLPLTVLRSFTAPPEALRDDSDAMRERVGSSVSGLLALLGIEADPVRSREHILLSTILDHAWRKGRDLDIVALIELIQNPPFERVGVLDLESFYPGKARFELAMSLNNLLASPGFAAWMEGDPLDVSRLLYTEDGKPRISILSIAHLSDEERMFFVTLVLNEVVTWMRSQSGTSSLRALLYMDEVFGYFPPTANPPSKKPLLTLMKQARAFGLGVVLATQNPVDLDYKGLSNAGTWFLGRLQTERDKMRVIEGLEGASAAAGSNFDRAKIEAILAGLSSRVFLMNNVHEDEPALFHTRWAMSYLRGPLTRNQIRELMADKRHARAKIATGDGPDEARPARPATTAPRSGASTGDLSASPPLLPPDIRSVFLPVTRSVPKDDALVYRPALLGTIRAHYVRTAARIDDWREVSLLAPLDGDTAIDPWEDAAKLGSGPEDLDEEADGRGIFDELPASAAKAKQHAKWSKALTNHVYREHALPLWRCALLKQYSALGEEERHFRIRLRDLLHERRDLAVEKLRKRYGPKLSTLQDRVRKAEQRVETERAQYRQSGLQTAISVGSTVLGALFGRKTMSTGNVSRAGTSIRRAGRTAQQRGDIGRAEDNLESLQQRLMDLEAEFQAEIEEAEALVDPQSLELEEITVRPRKGDLSIKAFSLAWAPYRTGDDGSAEAVFDQ